jgi:hypothetical protein
MEILRSIDIENIVRLALTDYFTIYCRPLPSNFTVPSLEVQRVGGTDANTIDTFDVVLDSRAKEPADADEQLRNAIGVLKQVAKDQTTAIRFIEVNSSGSWGNDPIRPDLAMCSARLRIVAHQEKTTINRR